MNPKKLARFIGRSAVVLPALGLFCISSTAFAAYQTWTNGVWPLDNNGNPIMTQAGGITKTGIPITGMVSSIRTMPRITMAGLANLLRRATA